MKNLSKQLELQVLKSKNETLIDIQKIETANATELTWYLNNLLPVAKQKVAFKSIEELKSYLTKRLELNSDKKLTRLLSELNFNDNLQQIETLKIVVEWKRSQMWGSNPTAEAYVNGVGMVSSGSISGCGYDKQSTAVANVLNQVPQLKKLLCKAKDKNASEKNNNIFGYGSGYGIIPSFEGGVGVECYNKILNKIGYKFETLVNAKNTDVYLITKF